MGQSAAIKKSATEYPSKLFAPPSPTSTQSATPAVRETKKQIKERKRRLKLAIKRLSKTKGAIRGIRR